MRTTVELSQPYNFFPGDVRKKPGMSLFVETVAFTMEHGCELQPKSTIPCFSE